MADDQRADSLDDVLAQVSHMRREMLKVLLAGAAGLAALPLMTSETLAGDPRPFSKTESERVNKSKKGKAGKGKAAKGKTGKGGSPPTPDVMVHPIRG